MVFFFFKQKTAYEVRISDWSSDLCSSDLTPRRKIPRPTPSPTPAAGPEAAPPLRRNRTPMGLDHVPTGSNVPEEINVVIEIPKDAEPVKYEVDKDSGAIFVDRILSTPIDRKSTRLNSSH